MFHENWYSDNQLTHLEKLARQVGSLDGKVIEIGCWEGKSTIVLANAVKNDIVLCVDTWLGNQAESLCTGSIHASEILAKERDVKQTFLENMTANTRGNFLPIQMECNEWLALQPETPFIKLCHVDASHDYRSVKTTLDLLVPRTICGGILCGDDFCSANMSRTDLQGGVERAVRETLDGFQTDGNLWFWTKP